MTIKSNSSSLQEKRKIFGRLFVVSVFIFFASYLLFLNTPLSDRLAQKTAKPIINDTFAKRNSIPPVTNTQSRTITNTAIIISIVSLLTSITTLIGFFSTTLLAWRKENRERLSAELDIKKKHLELEKLRLELGKSED